jgi:hypothetical protein
MSVATGACSTGVGLVKASRLLNEPEWAALAQRQLDWVLGANPFGASTMVGVGTNQPAQFRTMEFKLTTPLIAGAVMNGIGGTAEDQTALNPGSWQTCAYWTPMIGYTLWLTVELQEPSAKPLSPKRGDLAVNSGLPQNGVNKLSTTAMIVA